MACRRRPQRSAGVVVPAVGSGDTPSLPPTANFNWSGTWGQAFWSRGNELWVSSGKRLLQDIRQETQVTTGDFAWTPALISAVRQMLLNAAPAEVRAAIDSGRSLSAAQRAWTVPAIERSDPLSVEALRGAIFVTYFRGTPNLSPLDILIPVQFSSPVVGYVFPAGNDNRPTEVWSPFNAEALANNPFTGNPGRERGRVVQTGEGFNVTGNTGDTDNKVPGTSSSRSRSSNAGIGIAAALGVALLAMESRRGSSSSSSAGAAT